MGAGGVGVSARGAGSAASCDVGLFGRRMRLSRGLRHASYARSRRFRRLVLRAGSGSIILAIELCMLPCSVLCDVIRERSAGVASVLSDLFSVSSIPKCEYGTGVV